MQERIRIYNRNDSNIISVFERYILLNTMDIECNKNDILLELLANMRKKLKSTPSYMLLEDNFDQLAGPDDLP